MGPIQGGHVKAVAETFLANVRMHIHDKKQDSSPAFDLASQLEKLAEMNAQVLLSDEEFAAAKAKRL